MSESATLEKNFTGLEQITMNAARIQVDDKKIEVESVGRQQEIIAVVELRHHFDQQPGFRAHRTNPRQGGAVFSGRNV